MSESKDANSKLPLTYKQAGGIVGIVALIPFYQYFDSKYVQQVQFKNSTEQILRNQKDLNEFKVKVDDELKDLREEATKKQDEIKNLISKGFANTQTRIIRLEDLQRDERKDLERRVEKLEDRFNK